jgi:hypothetical protein
MASSAANSPAAAAPPRGLQAHGDRADTNEFLIGVGFRLKVTPAAHSTVPDCTTPQGSPLQAKSLQSSDRLGDISQVEVCQAQVEPCPGLPGSSPMAFR